MELKVECPASNSHGDLPRDISLCMSLFCHLNRAMNYVCLFWLRNERTDTYFSGKEKLPCLVRLLYALIPVKAPLVSNTARYQKLCKNVKIYLI